MHFVGTATAKPRTFTCHSRCSGQPSATIPARQIVLARISVVTSCCPAKIIGRFGGNSTSASSSASHTTIPPRYLLVLLKITEKASGKYSVRVHTVFTCDTLVQPCRARHAYLTRYRSVENYYLDTAALSHFSTFDVFHSFALKYQHITFSDRQGLSLHQNDTS